MIKTLFFGILIFSCSSAMAQGGGERKYAIQLDLDKPKVESLKSPEFSTDTKSKKWKQKDWLEMELKFKIKNIKPLPRDKTLPKLTVKWFVVAEDPNAPSGRKQYIRLDKEVVYVNIPVGEDVYISCYISPSGVRRLSNGGERASERIIFGFGGEIYLDGKLIDIFRSRDDMEKVNGKKVPFWMSPKLSKSNSVQIHDKSETPFKFMWWDRYAEIELKKSAEGVN